MTFMLNSYNWYDEDKVSYRWVGPGTFVKSLYMFLANGGTGVGLVCPY